MNFDIVFSGVGGMGVLSVATAIATSALEEGLHIQQSEVHGMSQRGGAVFASLRISDRPIESPLVAHGKATLLLSVEPLECFRYLEYLSPEGRIISSVNPMRNISKYPEISGVLDELRAIPGSVLVDAEKLAREAGSARAMNMVMVGAASPFLPFRADALEEAIRKKFARKGEAVVEVNLKAFRAGQEIAKSSPVRIKHV